MAFEKQSITWKDFYWGISQDDYLTTGNQVLYAENIDLTSSSDYIQLWKNSEWRYTTTDYVNGFIHAESGTNKQVFAYTDDGKIYDTEDGTVESTAIWDIIYTAFRFNWYIYFVSNHSTAPFSRITDANAYGNSNWAWMSVNFTLWTNISSTWWKIYPVLTYLDEFFYIWIWNTVYQVDNTDAVESFAIFDDDIVWLTRVGWVIKVYTKRGTIAFWDWESTSVDSVISIYEPIRWVISNGKIDYLICWHSDFQSRIKLLNWYTVQELSNARYSEVLWDYIWKVALTKPNLLHKIWDTIYFVQDGITWEDVYRFWTNNPVIKAWFNVWLAQDSNGNNISSIYSLYGIEFTSVDRLYVWVDSNSQTAFEYIDINTTSPIYKDEWYLILNPFDWWSKTIRKKIEYIMLSTSNCDASETVELQYSIDWWSYSSIQTINSWTSLTRTEIYDHLDFFYDINFKIIMSSAWSSDSPKLHELRLVYSLVEDND